MGRVIFKKSASKVLGKMPTGIRHRLRRELQAVANDPASYRGDWKRLRGSPYWRLRVGGYRAICAVESSELIILVLKISTRGDVYK